MKVQRRELHPASLLCLPTLRTSLLSRLFYYAGQRPISSVCTARCDEAPAHFWPRRFFPTLPFPAAANTTCPCSLRQRAAWGEPSPPLYTGLQSIESGIRTVFLCFCLPFSWAPQPYFTGPTHPPITSSPAPHHPAPCPPHRTTLPHFALLMSVRLFPRHRSPLLHFTSPTINILTRRLIPKMMRSSCV